MSRPVSLLIVSPIAVALIAITGGPLSYAFAAESTSAVTTSAPTFIDAVNAHFAAWDRDGNGEFSSAELDAAVSDPKVQGAEAAAIAAIKRAARIKTAHLPALTLESLRTLGASKADAARAVADGKTFEQDSVATAVNLDRFYDLALAKINRTKHVLFAPGQPSLSVVRQGKVGDCFCLAPLGAMLYRNPKQVEGIFAPQADGICNVTFGKQVIAVPLPTDAEIALTSAAEQSGFWVNLYEKAVGLSRIAAAAKNVAKSAPNVTAGGEGTPSLISATVKNKIVLPVDNIGRGGSAGTMLATLTGHPIERFSCAFAKSEKTTPAERDEKLKSLREKLTAAFAENRLVTCGTIKPTTPGITPNHAYAIVGYDATTDSLRIWNPHGDDFTPKGAPGPAYGYPRKAGLFSIPTADFVNQYSGVAFEVTKADAPVTEPSSTAN